MRVAIIGAGTVGSALGKAQVAAGHMVSVSATSPEEGTAAAAATGARAAANNVDAAPGADLDLDLDLDIDIDIDIDIEETAAARTFQRHLPNNPVVTAFNTVFAGRLGNPAKQGRHVH
ncbi:NAD(P)-binding domain-containing protein [Streptomyces sp. NPDC059272]|uniref:NAD(P)-binding domain-containing protein n=1 Tax=Streptomyces sp. NPDC059272 TaxID=3346800 RepID=UPI003696548B